VLVRSPEVRMAAREETSALIALQELRSIEEQRVSDERRAREAAVREARRRDEEARVRAEAERAAREREARKREAAERAARDHATDERARLREDLRAARARIDELLAQPAPAPLDDRRRRWPWALVGAGLGGAVAFALLAARAPAIRERVVYREAPVVAQPALTPTVVKLPAAPPPPRESARQRPPPPRAPTARQVAPKECDGDPLCHVDDALDDLKARPGKRRRE
jgi:hypothetical protein